MNYFSHSRQTTPSPAHTMFSITVTIPPPYSLTLKRYFQTVFPPAICSGPRATLSLDSPTIWLAQNSVKLFYFATSKAKSISASECLRIMQDTSPQLLSEYRDFLLPPNLVRHPIFSLDYPENWVSPAHLKAFIEHIPIYPFDVSDAYLVPGSAIQMLPTFSVRNNLDTSPTPSCLLEMDVLEHVRASKHIIHNIKAPVPRPFVSAAQLELFVGAASINQ